MNIFPTRTMFSKTVPIKIVFSHASGWGMLTCIMQNVIKLYDMVQELLLFSLTGNGRMDGLT